MPASDAMLRSLALLVVSVAACAAPEEPLPEPTSAVSEDTLAARAEFLNEAAAALAARAASADTAVVLALDPEGLRVVDPVAGTARLVAFGLAEADAVAAIEALRGTTAARAENAECGAGPLAFATWSDGFAMLFQDGAFAGWAQGTAEAPALTTLSGLGVGSTRADLDAAYAATVEETTLGTEFSTGDLFGILSGPGPDATVERVWAGVACTFR